LKLDDTVSPADFATTIAAADDAAAISAFVKDSAEMWSTMRALTLVACFRMKELFGTHATRAAATESTGYSSWTDWLTSIDWPLSVGLIRTRVLDMSTYRNAGASWGTVYGILANAPTAGHDAINTVISPRGQLLAHVDEDDLPGGSVEGLMEAIATAPNPGQGRALVHQVSGRPRVYPERMIATPSRIFLTLIFERPATTTTLNVEIIASDDDGMHMQMPSTVSAWLAEKLGATLESYEG